MSLKNKKGNIGVNKILVLIVAIIFIASVLIFIYKADILLYLKNLPGYSVSEEDSVLEGNDQRVVGSCDYQIAIIKEDYIYFCEDFFNNICNSPEKSIFRVIREKEGNLKIWVFGAWSTSKGVVGKIDSSGKIILDDPETISNKYGSNSEYGKYAKLFPYLNGGFLFVGSRICLNENSSKKEIEEKVLITQTPLSSYSFEGGILISISRNGNVFVNLTSGKKIPSTKPLQIIFKKGRNEYIDFVWNAKESRAYVRRSGGDVWNNHSFFLNDYSYLKNFYPYLDRVPDLVAIRTILGSSNFSVFVQNIYDQTKKNSGFFGNMEINNLNTLSVEDIKKKIYPYFDWETDWIIEKGKNVEENYFCDFSLLDDFGEKKGACKIDEDLAKQKKITLCMSDLDLGGDKTTEDFCGEECFCIKNYRTGDVFKFLIGNQEWEFKISSIKLEKRCVQNCVDEQSKNWGEIK
jgi:hypothetical protein